MAYWHSLWANWPRISQMDEGHSRFDPMRLWREYGVRLMRFGGVTVVTTVIGLATLFVGLAVFEWGEVIANFASVVVSLSLIHISEPTRPY